MPTGPDDVRSPGYTGSLRRTVKTTLLTRTRYRLRSSNAKIGLLRGRSEGVQREAVLQSGGLEFSVHSVRVEPALADAGLLGQIDDAQNLLRCTRECNRVRR